MLKGLILLSLIMVADSGINEGWQTIKNLFSQIGSVSFQMFKWVIEILPLVGVEDAIIVALVVSIIGVVGSGLGIYFNRKDLKNIKFIVSVIVEIISTLLMISSASTFCGE